MDIEIGNAAHDLNIKQPEGSAEVAKPKLLLEESAKQR